MRVKHKANYSDLLKSPKWQRKRLRILERDDFCCRVCRDRNSQLHVHHGFYKRGAAPWEYDDETLWTLCEKCHEKAEQDRAFLYEELAHIRLEWIDGLGMFLAESNTVGAVNPILGMAEAYAASRPLSIAFKSWTDFFRFWVFRLRNEMHEGIDGDGI